MKNNISLKLIKLCVFFILVIFNKKVLCMNSCNKKKLYINTNVLPAKNIQAIEVNNLQINPGDIQDILDKLTCKNIHLPLEMHVENFIFSSEQSRAEYRKQIEKLFLLIKNNNIEIEKLVLLNFDFKEILPNECKYTLTELIKNINTKKIKLKSCRGIRSDFLENLPKTIAILDLLEMNGNPEDAYHATPPEFHDKKYTEKLENLEETGVEIIKPYENFYSNSKFKSNSNLKSEDSPTQTPSSPKNRKFKLQSPKNIIPSIGSPENCSSMAPGPNLFSSEAPSPNNLMECK